MDKKIIKINDSNYSTKELKKVLAKDMTAQEKTYLILKAKGITPNLSRNAAEKNKDVKAEDIQKILETISDNNIVDYVEIIRNDKLDNRVLLKSNTTYNKRIKEFPSKNYVEKKCNMYFVMSINSGDVVSIYYDEDKTISPAIKKTVQKNTSRRGHFEKGIVKKTENQIKKHYSQMTKEEFEYLLIKVLFLKPSFSKHLKQKNSFFLKEDFTDILKNTTISNIIEYNETLSDGTWDNRVLLRSSNPYKARIRNSETNKYETKDCCLCFVISIISGEIITAYYNEHCDEHDNIDMKRYNSKLKILK